MLCWCNQLQLRTRIDTFSGIIDPSQEIAVDRSPPTATASRFELFSEDETMNLFGPLICLLIGFMIFSAAWMSGLGPPEHNIGRGIASSIFRQAFEIIGGFTIIWGLIWLFIRWFEPPAK